MRSLHINRYVKAADRTETVERYFRDVKELEFNLTREEEADLARRIRTGSRAALNELVNCNLRFVVSVANQYSGYAQLEDLINEGNLGLIKAAHKFDESRGVKFVSYAVWWIRDSILKYVATVHPMIRVPMEKASDTLRFKTMERLLEQALERKPSVSEMTDALNAIPGKSYSDSVVEQLAQNASRSKVSLDDAFFVDVKIDDDDDDVAIEPADDTTDESESVNNKVLNSLNKLNDREQQVIKSFFGFTGPSKTLDEISKDLGISAERTRQLRNSALEKLKENISPEFFPFAK